MKVTILASGSSGDCHPVDFSDDSGSLRVFCHCEAGSYQQMCKHKLALLKGDRMMLYDRDQEKLLTEVLSSPAYPTLKRRLDEYEKQLEGVEREMDKLKEHVKTLKKDLAYELTHGHPKG
ncbi:MAG: hypothetical protein ABSF91_12085 [Bacteroidota bacterium]|jgi:hypothetical protein